MIKDVLLFIKNVNRVGNKKGVNFFLLCVRGFYFKKLFKVI